MTQEQIQDNHVGIQPSENIVSPTKPDSVNSVDSIEPAQPKTNRIVTLLIFVALLLLGGWYAYKQIATPTDRPLTSSPSPTQATSTGTQNIKTKMAKYFNIGDVNVGIPDGWEISISQKTENLFSARIYPPKTDRTKTFAEIQIGDSNTMTTNNLLALSSIDSQNGLTVREGKENLLKSERSVLQIEKNMGNTRAVVTFFGSSTDIASNRQAIIDMLANNVQSGINLFNFVRRVKAQEVASESGAQHTQVADIPVSQAKSIEIMDGPYPERITSQDVAYKDGYAKLFKFDYIKGQRIEVLAEENSEDLKNTGSFIESELYFADPQNPTQPTLIMEAGTRISPQGQKTLESGTYYLIVNSFGHKEGRFLVKIFDLDQVNDLYYAKFADGSEHPLNTDTRVSSKQEAVLLVRFTGPIEIVGDSSVRWFRKQDNACISSCLGNYAYGDVTVPFTVQVNQVTVPIKVTKLFMNQVIIQPAAGGGFPVNSNIGFSFDFGEDPNIPGSRSGYSGGFGTF